MNRRVDSDNQDQGDGPNLLFYSCTNAHIRPFRALALYASSVEIIVGQRISLFGAAIGASILMMVIPQAMLLRLVLQSRYNWFHLF